MHFCKILAFVPRDLTTFNTLKHIQTVIQGFTRFGLFFVHERVVWWNAVRSTIIIVVDINTQRFSKVGWPARQEVEKRKGKYVANDENYLGFTGVFISENLLLSCFPIELFFFFENLPVLSFPSPPSFTFFLQNVFTLFPVSALSVLTLHTLYSSTHTHTHHFVAAYVVQYVVSILDLAGCIPCHS